VSIEVLNPEPRTLNTPLAPAIRSTLAALRRRIRRYVVLHGLTAATAWLGIAFWASLAIDRLFEPPPSVRAIVLGVAALGLGWLLFRLVLRRAFARLTDRNMAMLLERRFPQFDESLLTAVELAEGPADVGLPPAGDVGLPPGGDVRSLGERAGRQMLVRTCRQAAASVGEVRLGEVFNAGPLRRSTLAAVLLAASVGTFGAMAPETWGIWTQRSLLLGDRLWPRKTRLVVEGFDRGVTKVARGDDLEVIAKADLSKPRVPSVVEVRYRTEGGARLRGTMSREGTVDPARDRYQEYSYTFRGVLTPIRFDLFGGDDAIRDLRIEVVPSPTIVDMALECHYPDYMDRPPRTLPVAGVMQIPAGTRITVRATANKELVEVQVDDGERIATIRNREDDGPAGGDRVAEPRAAVGFRRFAYRLASLTGDKSLRFTLLDADGIRSGRPVRLALATVPDAPPQLAVELRGIGAAITPRARLPATGRIGDDYGISRVWFDYTIDEGEEAGRSGIASDDAGPETHPIASLAGNVTDFPLDHALEVRTMRLAPGRRLLACVKAADRCTIAGKPNVGTSRRWLLDVVTPEQLRTMLEARELMLRQRFERIMQEVTETRDLLQRMEFGDPAAEAEPPTPQGEKPKRDGDRPASEAGSPLGDTPTSPGDDPDGDASTSEANHDQASGEEDEAGDEPAGETAESDGDEPAGETAESDAGQPLSPQRILARRTLRAQRATQNSRKNADETLGVSEAFAGIREELINNRIDTAELSDRLQRGIADPLRGIAEEMFPELERRLDRLEASLGDGRAGPRNRQLAVAQIDAILEAMQGVLDRMLELEDFNKAVELLQEIIHAQDRLSERTRKRHKEKLRDLLED
jgi:hypothetical protein